MKKAITVLYPGGFKPLTGGHLSLIKKYVECPDVAEVKVIISKGIRDGIDQETAIRVAETFLRDLDKVSIEASRFPSPILTAYKYVTEAKPGEYTLASSTKGDDFKRTKEFTEKHAAGGKYSKFLPKGVHIRMLPVDPSPAIYETRWDINARSPISASILRRDVLDKNHEHFASNYPEEDREKVEQAWELLFGTVKEEDE